MQSRNEAFGEGTVAGSPELARQRLVNQQQAGGLLPGQNGQSAGTYDAGNPLIAQYLRTGY